MDNKETSKLTKIVTDLFYKYQANPVIFNKFTQYIENLPELLENTNTTIIEREQRKNKLEYESETFIQKFLHNHKFFDHLLCLANIIHIFNIFFLTYQYQNTIIVIN